MNEENDLYKTVLEASEEVLIKEKNSKFFGYVFPLESKEKVKNILLTLKKKHQSAGHFCYAWQLGTIKKEYRANDDGEPNGSAGIPIYGQIKSHDITNVIIIVVRYFGGTKLGVSGLINAYKSTAKQAIEVSKVVEKTIDLKYRLTFEYKQLNNVMRIVKNKKIQIIDQKMELDCVMDISVRKKTADSVFDLFDRMQNIKIIQIQ